MNRVFSLLSAVLVLGLAGCQVSNESSPVLAKVNLELITLNDLQRERDFYNVVPGVEPTPGVSPKSDQQLLDSLIDQVLIRQRASQLEIALQDQEIDEKVRLATLGSPPADFEKSLRSQGLKLSHWRRRLAGQMLAETVFRRDNQERMVITPRQVKDYYWEHVDRYRYSRRVLLRQVVCEKREHTEAALKELLLGDPFEDVVRRYSTGPEAVAGGRLGWRSKKDLPAELAEAAFKLKKGKLSGVVESAHGFHLLKVDDIQRPRNLSIEEANLSVRERLKEKMEQEVYREWLFNLRKAAAIEQLSPAGGNS